jgi:hypothetical protein
MKDTKTTSSHDENSKIPMSVFLLACVALLILIVIILGMAELASYVQTQP